jgi:hypothetical protein
MSVNHRRRIVSSGLVVCLLCVAGVPAWATWSIVLTDTSTGEIAIGQATCVTGIDLMALTPAVVNGVGAGTVAGFVDTTGTARTIIRDELLAGALPHEILQTGSVLDPDFETHQYSIAHVDGFSVTYTGTAVAAGSHWFGGQAGTDGEIRYAVSGNVLAGAPVVDEAVAAILATDGSLTDKLMAAMEAARAMGGDGRCSCSQANPTGCGSPPASFEKSAHVGFMALIRAGDLPVDCINCTAADFVMNLNVANQGSSAEDPVLQLATLYDEWKSLRKRRPDAVESIVSLTPPSLLPDGVSTSQMEISLLDLNGQPIAVPIQSLTVTHASNSDGVTTIGTVIDNGDGSYSVTLTVGTTAGVDRFDVVADDGTRAVTLMPLPVLSVGSPGAVENVRWSNRETMEWDPELSGVAYHIYSGEIGDLTCNFFGTCRDDLDTVRTDLRLVFPDDPLPEEFLFFLITSEDAGNNEGPLAPSTCGPRSNPNPCP